MIAKNMTIAVITTTNYRLLLGQFREDVDKLLRTTHRYVKSRRWIHPLLDYDNLRHPPP